VFLGQPLPYFRQPHALLIVVAEKKITADKNTAAAALKTHLAETAAQPLLIRHWKA